MKRFYAVWAAVPKKGRKRPVHLSEVPTGATIVCGARQANCVPVPGFPPGRQPRYIIKARAEEMGLDLCGHCFRDKPGL